MYLAYVTVLEIFTDLSMCTVYSVYVFYNLVFCVRRTQLFSHALNKATANN